MIEAWIDKDPARAELPATSTQAVKSGGLAGPGPWPGLTLKYRGPNSVHIHKAITTRYRSRDTDGTF